MTGTSLRGSKAAIYPAPWMADNPEHSHLITFPEALEALFSRMGELKVVLGPAAAPGVDEVEGGAEVQRARDLGDRGARVAALARDGPPRRPRGPRGRRRGRHDARDRRALPPGACPRRTRGGEGDGGRHARPLGERAHAEEATLTQEAVRVIMAAAANDPGAASGV